MAEQYTNRAYGSKHTSARKRRRKRSNIGKKTALIITMTVIIAAVIILIGMQIGKKPNVLVGTWVYDEHTQYIFEKDGTENYLPMK